MSDLPTFSEEDEKRFERLRNRSNKISKIMGDYLLKGYKMLGTSCNKCQTVLLRDRQGEDYCVGCIEVDVQIPPQVEQQQPDITKVHSTRNVNPTVSMETNSNSNTSPSKDFDIENHNEQLRFSSIRNLQAQISWANTCLAANNLHLDARTQFVVFIRTCYETLNMLMKTS